MSDTRLLKRIVKNSGAVVGLSIILVLLFLAIFAPYLTSKDPYAMNAQNAFQAPSRAFPLGTDHMGRDILTRILFGARISFQVALLAIVIVNIIGLPAGAIAGYYGGFIDNLIMRITDIFLAFPSFLLAMTITAVMGRGLYNAILAVALARWASYARLVRSGFISTKSHEFVEGATAIGVKPIFIMLKHILPNCWAPLIVHLTMDAGLTILMLSGLGFIGLGAPAPLPEWGAMVARGRQYLTTFWWIPLFPGLAISLMVSGWIFLGDAIRDLLDPRFKT